MINTLKSRLFGGKIKIKTRQGVRLTANLNSYRDYERVINWLIDEQERYKTRSVIVEKEVG